MHVRLRPASIRPGAPRARRGRAAVPAGRRRRSRSPRKGSRGRLPRSARHGASPRIRGTRKRNRLHLRRLGQHLVPVEARGHHVVAQDVARRQRVGGRRHSGGVEGLDVRACSSTAPSCSVKRSSSSGVSASRARRATWATSLGRDAGRHDDMLGGASWPPPRFCRCSPRDRSTLAFARPTPAFGARRRFYGCQTGGGEKASRSQVRTSP